MATFQYKPQISQGGSGGGPVWVSDRVGGVSGPGGSYGGSLGGTCGNWELANCRGRLNAARRLRQLRDLLGELTRAQLTWPAFGPEAKEYINNCFCSETPILPGGREGPRGTQQI